MTPHLHAHPFRLVLVTESPTAPTVESAFLVCMGHRIQGADPGTVARNATLDGTLKGVSILPYSPDPEAPKGQTKRPGRKAYRRMINDLLHLVQCDDYMDLAQFQRTVKAAKHLMEK